MWFLYFFSWKWPNQTNPTGKGVRRLEKVISSFFPLALALGNGQTKSYWKGVWRLGNVISSICLIWFPCCGKYNGQMRQILLGLTHISQQFTILGTLLTYKSNGLIAPYALNRNQLKDFNHIFDQIVHSVGDTVYITEQSILRPWEPFSCTCEHDPEFSFWNHE